MREVNSDEIIGCLLFNTRPVCRPLSDSNGVPLRGVVFSSALGGPQRLSDPHFVICGNNRLFRPTTDSPYALLSLVAAKKGKLGLREDGAARASVVH